MQNIHHVKSNQPVTTVGTPHLHPPALTQGSSSGAGQKSVQSLISQGLHDKNPPPALEQGSGSQIKNQGARLMHLESSLSSGNMIHSLPRTMRESLASGGPIKSLSRSVSAMASIGEGQEQHSGSLSGRESRRSDRFFTPSSSFSSSSRRSDADSDFHSARSSPAASARHEAPEDTRRRVFERGESSQAPIDRMKKTPPTKLWARLRASLASGGPIQGMSRFAPVSQLRVKIDDQGKLQFGKGLPDSLTTLLRQTLGKNSQPFVAHHENEETKQHTLLDKSGRLFVIQSAGEHHIALHSSGRSAIPGAGKQGAGGMQLAQTPGQITLQSASGESLNVPLSSRMNLELLTGVYQPSASTDESLRIHDGKLFALNSEFGVWQKTGEASHSQLSRQGDGQLYAVKDAHTLSNLTSGTETSPFSDKISAFSANQHGRVAVLTEQNHMTTLHLLSSLNDTFQPVELKREEQEPVHAHAVAISAKQLLIADNAGKLYHAPLPAAGESSATLTPYDTPALDSTLGADRRITGFAHDEHGQLHALASDNQGQRHVASLGENGMSPASGWNLSDSLVVDNTLGLTPPAPAGIDTLDLGRQGKLGLQDGNVNFYNDNTQSWEASGVKAGQLKRGLDNQAYILSDGEIRPLSINQHSTAFKQGDDNVFSLPQVRPTPSAGAPLPGIDKDEGISAISVINSNKFIAVNRQGELHFHHFKPGSDKPAEPPLALPRNGLTGEIRDITLDSQQNLFALNHEGTLFKLPKSEWQKADNPVEAQWLPVRTPIDGKINAVGIDAQNRLQIAHDEHRLHTLQAGTWKTEVPKGQEGGNSQIRAADTVFNTLDIATKGRRVPHTGIDIRADVQQFGNIGAESQQVKSKLSDLVRAHIFTFSLETPRPLKTLGQHIQHQIAGREGLKPVYDMQTALLKKLETAAAQSHPPAADLASKIATLDLGENGRPLMKLLKQFHTELENSSAKSALIIGRDARLLNDKGALEMKGKAASPLPLLNGALSRQDKNLAPLLLTAMQNLPSSKENTARSLIRAFVDSKTPIHQKLNTDSTAQQRDSGDMTSLAKTRLVLDTLVLGDLHTLVDRLGELSGSAPDEAALAPLTTSLNTLRQREYGENPIKKLTDIGFTNNKSLEADYDAIKTFMKAFRNEDHAVNVTARSVMKSASQPELVEKMKATLLSLDQDESITFSRNYGGGAALSFVITGTPLPFPPIPGGGISGERNYNMTFLRENSNSVNVSFERNGGITGKLTYGGGYDVSQYLLGKTSGEMIQSINSNHSLTPDVWASFSIAASLQMAQQNALNFSLTEDELPAFIDGLSSGTLNPLSLMDKGEQHSVTSGRTVSFSLDGSAALDLRGGINFTVDGAEPTSVLMRSSIGVTAGVNMLSAKSASSTLQGENRTTYIESDNRMRAMNQINLGANASITAGVLQTTADGLIPVFGSTGIGVNVSVDSRTDQSIWLNMKKAQPLEPKDIDAITQTLSSAFTDPASRLLIDSVKKMAEPDEQLAILSEHFADKEVQNNEQHQGLMSLKRLNIRQDVTSRDGAILDSVQHITSYTNLSKLTENGLFRVLSSHLFSTLPPSNADRVGQLIAGNPALNDIVSRLQDNDNSTVMVTLELKDQVREEAERGIQNKTHGKNEVIALFKDRNNLRLASINVFQTVKKSEGFNSPAVIVNASSNASVSMSKLLGSVSFSYGQDQTVPQSYKLGGEIAKAPPSTANALQQLQQHGLQLKA